MNGDLISLKEKFVELLTIQDKDVFASSRVVATEFGKLHKHVLDSINQGDFSIEFRQSNFRLAHYKDAQDKPRPYYLMTRDGFSFIVMGFTGKKAAMFKEAFIYAFNEMENRLKNAQKSIIPNFDDPIEAAESWIAERKARLLAEAKAEENQIKADSFDEVCNALGYETIENFCKIINVKPYKFRAWLREKKYTMTSGDNHNMPYQYWMPYFQIVEKLCEDGVARKVTLLNNKGVVYFTKKKIKGELNHIIKYTS